ncbi:hypothetical protein [Nocardia sp. NRRL S-836]|uniref:hypothetical protein n=1 Tax=Nocardia sp. NRRL S-836 TaxID=1519492 RepID=UPI0012F8D806|nr:hypothetical protein [Nocardia sp. NRRL S-836]
MLTRKALLIPATASAGLLVVLAVAGWGGDSDPQSAAPSGGPHTSTTQQVSIVPTPELAEITVKTTTSTTTTTTTRITTKPPPPPVQPPPAPPVTTTEAPQRGLFVNEGARCDPEGAIGIGLRGEPLVCRKDERRAERLRWQKA